MLKQMLFMGAAALSFPALAQEMPQSDPTSPPPAEMSAPPAGDVAAQPAPPGTAATPTQVAQIVNQEFPTYDADGNGELDTAEFSAWMKKLRAATDPSVDTESEAVKSWIGQAFTAADADKSSSVNKAELTSFLSRGA